MKIFNKFIWSKKEPSNKNDIWFDGSTWRMYTEEAWQSFTLPVDAADKVAKVIENASEVYQEKLNAGEGIIIENNVISAILQDLSEYAKIDDIATINGQSLTEGGNIVIPTGGESYDDAEIKQQITELSAEVGKKQDTIADLETIREGASKGATAIQSVKTINGESIVGEGDITIQGGSTTGCVEGVEFPFKSKIEEINFTWQAGYIRSNGVQQSTGYHYRIDGVQEGDEFHVLDLTTQSAYSAYPVMFVKEDDTIEAGTYETGTGTYLLKNASVQCPANTKAIIFNSRYNDRPLAKTIGNIGLVEYNNISEQITTDLRPMTAEVEEVVIEEGKRVNDARIGTSPAIISNSDYDLYSLDVKEGERYFILNRTSAPLQWAVVSSYNLTIENNNSITGFQVIEIPKFATKLYLNVERRNKSNVVPPILKVVGYMPYEHDWRRYKWDAIGDSLTDATINALYKYHYYTKMGTGIDVNVLGKGGAGYWRTNNDITFRILAESVREDADIVTIFGSINDWVAKSPPNNIPNGEPSDTIEANTLSGYINATIDKVMEKAPNAMVVLVSAMFYKGILQSRQEELVETLRKVAEYRMLPFVDMYHTTMFNRIVEKTFGETYTTDYSETAETYGHPSDLAHYKFIFPRFVSILAEHLPILNLKNL